MNKTTLLTILSRVIVLALNFLIVVVTTQLWGAEGRGIIAIFIADVSLAAMVMNIFTGSSTSYFTSKMGFNSLLAPAYVWAFLVSSIIGAIFLFTKNSDIALFFWIISSVSGFLSFHNAFFLGKQQIKPYNLIAILQPLLLIIFMIVIQYITSFSYFSYFIAQAISISILLCYGWYITKKEVKEVKPSWSWEKVKTIFIFGWKVELSNVLQFLNYRLAFYFIGFYLGNASVGIFSVGVAISEALWVFSRSISVVQYSKTLQVGDTPESRTEIIRAALLSTACTFVAAIILLIFPDTFFTLIFGSEFTGIKPILLALLPGIIAIAFSNLLANFFSAAGKINILIFKSAVGVAVNIVLLVLLLKNQDLLGACYAASISYFASSLVLILYFIYAKKEKKYIKID